MKKTITINGDWVSDIMYECSAPEHLTIQLALLMMSEDKTVNHIDRKRALSIYQTSIDEEIEHDNCEGCKFEGGYSNVFPCSQCSVNYTSLYRYDKGDDE